MATLYAPAQIAPHEDAEAIYKAVKGWGTDEKAVINILGHRNATQRTQIRQAFNDLYQEDLIKRLESELKGDFERAVYRWIYEPAEREAILANVAVRKYSSNSANVIVEISCVSSPEELLAVKRAYHYRYKRSLEEDVAANTSGDTRKLLLALVSTFRYGGDEINPKLAKSEANILHAAIKDKSYNHDEVIRILTTRSKAQLVATFNQYRDDHGNSVSKDLLGDSKHELAATLLSVVRCISDPKKYFEKLLRSAIKRTGTDEDALTRVIVSRAEKDLKEIKDLYFKKNSIPLADAVAKDTSGDYKAFLLTLLG